jgi:hypothetical protein
MSFIVSTSSGCGAVRTWKRLPTNGISPVAAPALAQLLRDHEDVRFVTTEKVDLGEFPELSSRAAQVEVRGLVPFNQLPLKSDASM